MPDRPLRCRWLVKIQVHSGEICCGVKTPRSDKHIDDRQFDKILDDILHAKGSNDAPPKERTAETTTAEAKKP